MILDIAIGLGFLAFGGGVVYLVKHKGPPPAVQPAKDVAVSVVANLESLLDEKLSGVPALVSTAVVDLQGQLQAALKRAEEAEAKVEAQGAAHAAQLAAVAARVASAIQDSPELPKAARKAS